MDAKQDSIDNWNKLKESERIALCAYWFDLLRGNPSQGIIDFISKNQEKASVFDVPEVVSKH